MSYTFEDFFDQDLAPRLKNLLDSDVEDKADQFLSLLENGFCGEPGERFVGLIIRKIIDQDSVELEQLMEKIFYAISSMHDDIVLKKLEYYNNGNLIRVKYKDQLCREDAKSQTPSIGDDRLCG